MNILSNWRLTHGPTVQVETATVVAASGCTANGNLVVTITGSAISGSPLAVPVALTTAAHTSASLIAAAIRTALAIAAITTRYTVGGSGAAVTLTSKVPQANDGTLNIAIAAGLGVDVAGTSASTTPGTGTVILNYGDEIAAEPRWPLRKGLEVIALVDAANSYLRPTGGNVHTIQLDVFADEALDATARQSIMASLINAAGLGKAALVIEIYGITDRYWSFASAAVTDHTPARIIDAATARLVKTWSITAATLTQVGP